jgi:N-methylhydantoinase A
MAPLASYSPKALEEAFANLEEDAKRQLAEQGLPAAGIEIVRAYKGMYVGQTWDNPYPAPLGSYTSETLDSIEQTFHTLYEQRSGSSSPELPIMVTALEVTAVVRRRGTERYQSTGQRTGGDGTPEKTAPVWWSGQQLDTPFINRDNLPIGEPIAGPAVVVEPHSTTTVPPGCQVEAHAAGHLTLAWTNQREGE